jgi:hypothetical protein
VISRLSAEASRAADLTSPDKQAVNLVDILLRNPPIEYACNQEADIHSAGFNRYISGAITSLVIAALTGALLGIPRTASKEDGEFGIPHIRVINTSPGADPQCTARVSEATARVLGILGADQTWILCQAPRDAQARAGMRSSAPATPAARPAQR